jgi:thiamine biosynthesis protein ThiS
VKTILLNGETHSTAAESVMDLTRELALVPETLLVEHNGLALHRSEWIATKLTDQDRVEMLRVAAGG